MSANEEMNTSSTGAQKAGNDERYDLIPAGPLRDLARHFGVGAKKYEDRNWERGYDWSLSYAALNRHLWAFWSGEDIDAETGTPHITAVAWHAFTLSEFAKTHPEFDNRPSTLAAKRYDDPEVKKEFLKAISTGGSVPSSAVSLVAAGGGGGGNSSGISTSASGTPGGGGGGGGRSSHAAFVPAYPKRVENLREEWTRQFEWRHITGLRYRYVDGGWQYFSTLTDMWKPSAIGSSPNYKPTGFTRP